MNRMSHWRQPRAKQQDMKRVAHQQALSRQAREIDKCRLSEKTAKPSTPESDR